MDATVNAVPTFGNPAQGLDDDIFALAQQLKELRVASDRDKGKYPEGQLPDAMRAVREYQDEVSACLQRLTDLRLAHNVAHAVATDGPVIASFIDVEVQAEQDRRTALQTSVDDPELESPAAPPPPYEAHVADSFGAVLMLAQKNYVRDPQWDTYDSDGEASSSRDSTYTERQDKGLKTFSSPAATCCACSGRFRASKVLRLDCDDVFCRGCLRKVIMNSMKDKTMFPPKCHRQALSQQIIHGLLTAEELKEFQNTELEVSCPVKTYCSNASCGRFIPPAQITADRAHCARCGTSTCTNCRNKFHEDDCPEDPLLQATLALAADHKWQRCYSCRAVVILAKACNHIR